MYTGIICACIPCLRPLAKRHLPRLFSPTRSQNGWVLPLKTIPTAGRQHPLARGSLERHHANDIQGHGSSGSLTQATRSIPERSYASENSEVDEDISVPWPTHDGQELGPGHEYGIKYHAGELHNPNSLPSAERRSNSCCQPATLRPSNRN